MSGGGMKTPNGFRRGAATTAVFLLFGPFIAGLLVAGLFLLGRSLVEAPVEPESANIVLLSGVLGGFLLQLVPGLVTGLGMSFASGRIYSVRGWLGWSALSSTALSVGVCSLVVWLTAADTGWGPMIVMLMALGVPGALGGLAAAAATLRLRPPPSPRPTADVFA